jgi:hypothetical protein
MTIGSEHRAVRQYLDDLRHATRKLPRDRQRRLLAEIEAHLAETAPNDASEAEVREALDRLGDPRQIADAELDIRVSAARQPAWQEWLAIPLLLVGGVVSLGIGSVAAGTSGQVALAGVGWLGGVLLLWLSPLWTVRDKLVGTLVLPGGLLPALYLTLAGVSVETCASGADGTSHCTGGMSTGERVGLIALWLLLVAAPIATGVYLGRRLQNKSDTLPG